MSRVLSSEEAKQAIRKLQQLIDGDLMQQIQALDAQGKILSQPDVWDGPLAQQFRGGTWPETKAALDKCQQELNDLRQQIQVISQNIMTAGGSN